MIDRKVGGDVPAAWMCVQEDADEHALTGRVSLPILVVALALAGCAGSSSSASSGDLPPGRMTITPAVGGASFDPRCVTSAALIGTMLNVSCGAGQETYAAIVIRAYHGPGTYTLTSSDDGTVQFVDVESVLFGIPKRQPGVPATKCAAEIKGPASPARGDVISGTFHCDNLMGNRLYGDGGYQPPVYRAVDGSFEAPTFASGHADQRGQPE
ncbi:MAG: hypothetical protein IPG50_18135 [Myxococcales bacterium]|nr:hypothetical protein [Myxococcales bacterium]